jgi:hypothetical protein
VTVRDVPVLRSGVLAQAFCARITQARVEAVFARSFYLRSGDSFLCIGAPEIGNGPLTLIGDIDLSDLALQGGQSAAVSNRDIAIGAVRFTLDRSETWGPDAWPRCPPRARLIEICRELRGRAEAGGLARAPFEQAARARIARFGLCGLIGLGPGLTPSGDDVLSGALATLDALGEHAAHADLARTVEENSSSTSPLSAALLQAAAGRQVGEHLHRMVSSVLTGDVDTALAIAGNVGDSSGWDMLAGITSTLAQSAYASAA